MTKTEIEIRHEVLTTIEANIARIETEIAANRPGFVHVWPGYGLGVRIDSEGKPAVVCVSLATIVKANDARKFFNGANYPAVVTERAIALERALASIKASHAALKAALG